MHSLSVSVCPCPSETECAHTFCMGICDSIVLTCCRVLTRLRSASSLSLGGSPHELFNLKYLFNTVLHDGMLVLLIMTHTAEYLIHYGMDKPGCTQFL